MNAEQEEERDLEIISKYCDLLAEHFDTVEIFCTRVQQDGTGDTVVLNLGCGNWYARYGQIREWLIRSDQKARNKESSEDS
jgi:hypothetical protein